VLAATLHEERPKESYCYSFSGSSQKTSFVLIRILFRSYYVHTPVTTPVISGMGGVIKKQQKGEKDKLGRDNDPCEREITDGEISVAE